MQMLQNRRYLLAWQFVSRFQNPDCFDLHDLGNENCALFFNMPPRSFNLFNLTRVIDYQPDQNIGINSYHFQLDSE